jgi:formylglycine-generating enzyme required for sulfatase activity
VKHRTFRVCRGGSYDFVTWNLRSSFRNWRESEDRVRFVGFRIVVIMRKQGSEPT